MTGNGSPVAGNQAEEARRWLMGGRVQGVGFRGFVFNLALRLNLRGTVQNLTGEVLIEAQGEAEALDQFAAALVAEAPQLARPHVISCDTIGVRDWNGFEILRSAEAAKSNVHVPPDSFLCEICRSEMLDPQDRRYRYPFTNCTQCGPRYTLITRMPYDRPHTTMADFPLCPECGKEYRDPRNRRFHAQPLACPACGPRLSYSGKDSHATGDAALQACLEALRRGEVVAVKGVGGYHLMCDAMNADAIAALRTNKHRPHKPLALMFPWQGMDGLQRVRAELELDAATAAALADAARPIVLAPRRGDCALPQEIAPGLNEIGAMLPYSPLHHLLLDEFGGPLVATSGNVSGEPVLTDNVEAEARLAGVAQAFLHHNRQIARPADDSVVRVIAGKARLLRAGRGVAPLEFALPFTLPQPLLAVGGHMKNSIALAWNNRAVLSPHIGDLDAPRSLEIFEQVAADLQQLYGIAAQSIVCDAHPGYASSRWAERQALPVRRVQHHYAHAAALALEAGLSKTWLIFTWDGMGLGEDATLWGGEALYGRPAAWRRVATFKPFRLPGGERAGREPWRAAAAVSWESGLEWRSGRSETSLLRRAWEHELNAPTTSAAGRLFDAAASLLGLCDIASFEGQGPMLLEAEAARFAETGSEVEALALPLQETASGLVVADWTRLLHAMRREDLPHGQRALQFHTTLAACIAAQARYLSERMRFDAVGLTGGVFQNKLLAELAIRQLSSAGFDAYLPEQAPCNDGGLALGQLVEAGYQHG
jgi:hydrogenase maturation protein HypF